MSAITIFPIHPDNGNGWNTSTHFSKVCRGEKNEAEFINCIENNAYSAKDIIQYIPNEYRLENFYTVQYRGIVKSLHIDTGGKPTYFYYLRFNGNIRYYIYFTDIKLQFIPGNPSMIPRTMLPIKEREGQILLYLEVKFLFKFPN